MKPKQFSVEWRKISAQQIIEGKVHSKGNSYKLLLARDYSAINPNETLNLSCPSCIKSYLKTLQSYIPMDSNEKKECSYRLIKKRENIWLEFGSDVMVNNQNITDEMAETLIARFQKLAKDAGREFKMTDLFEVFPDENVVIVEKGAKEKAPKEPKAPKAKKDAVNDEKKPTEPSTPSTEENAPDDVKTTEKVETPADLVPTTPEIENIEVDEDAEEKPEVAPDFDLDNENDNIVIAD